MFDDLEFGGIVWGEEDVALGQENAPRGSLIVISP